jgi:hypothetical protein
MPWPRLRQVPLAEAVRGGFGAGEGSQMLFFVLKLCVYTHKPLQVVAGHCFGLRVVDGVCPCSMDEALPS